MVFYTVKKKDISNDLVLKRLCCCGYIIHFGMHFICSKISLPAMQENEGRALCYTCGFYGKSPNTASSEILPLL